MCGIIAYLGYTPGIKKLYEGLVILQNRGYDSAGISTVAVNKFIIHKYANQENKNAFQLLESDIDKHVDSYNCIGHSRWACTGSPTDVNSHPHIDYTNKISLVHNGIIENYNIIKAELIQKGIPFKSNTDTEVISNLIGYYYKENNNILNAIKIALNRLEGTWGLVIQCLDYPDNLYCARHGSPLLIGFESDYAMISSEQSGFSRHVKNYISLENNDIIVLEKNNNRVIFNEIHNYNILQVED